MGKGGKIRAKIRLYEKILCFGPPWSPLIVEKKSAIFHKIYKQSRAMVVCTITTAL